MTEPPATPVPAGPGRRILITGLSSGLGGRLAQLLERERDVEAIVGIDTEDPRHELARTEFVRIAIARRPLARILTAAAIDTVIDTRLLADPLLAPVAAIREVAGAQTRELLDALADSQSPVARLVVRSSAAVYGWRAGAPAFLGEEMAPPAREARTAVQRALLEAEAAIAAFAARQQSTVTVLRCAEEVGAEGRTSLLSLLSLPVIPSVLGFDPRFQLIHAEDVVGVLAHAARTEMPGLYNAAGDGVLALSEIASLLGKPLLPVLPPWGTMFAAAQLRRVGARVPVEMLAQLRFSRGLDNRRLKAAGYRYRYTTREAVLRLGADQRRRPLLGPGEGEDAYNYDPGLERFLRWSPSVHSARARAGEGGGDEPVVPELDGLAEADLIALIDSLEPDALSALRDLERANGGRPAILDALDSTLARRRG